MKRSVALSLFATFMAYSMYVYTAGTDTPQPVALDDKVSAGQRLFQENNCIANWFRNRRCCSRFGNPVKLMTEMRL